MRKGSAYLTWSLVALAFIGCTRDADPPRSELDPQIAAGVEAMQAAYHQGEFYLALSLADSIERRVSGLPEVEYTRGLVFNALRQYPRAQQALTRVVTSDPEFRGAWYHLGHNAFLQRRYRDAIDYYERERSLVSGLRERGEEVDPQALPSIVAQIGRAYDRMGLQDSARIVYEEALSIDSSLAVAQAWLSEWYENQGQLEEAFHHARRAVHADPENLEYIYRLGYLYLQNGYPAEALPFLGVVAQRWPGHEGASYNLGRALMATGQEEEGRSLLDRVEAIQKLQEEALVAERGVETYPNDPRRWVTLAELMLRSGYLEKAEQAFQVAHTLDPKDLSLQNDLANLALARGDTTAAIERYQNLLARDSTQTDSWLNLGNVYALQGRSDDARFAWEQVLRLRPHDADARKYLAGLESAQRTAAN